MSKKTFAQITIRIALFEIRQLIRSNDLGFIEFLLCCSLESTSQCKTITRYNAQYNKQWITHIPVLISNYI